MAGKTLSYSNYQMTRSRLNALVAATELNVTDQRVPAKIPPPGRMIFIFEVLCDDPAIGEHVSQEVDRWR